MVMHRISLMLPRAASTEAHPHMLYARTLPLPSRADRNALDLVCQAFDGLLLNSMSPLPVHTVLASFEGLPPAVDDLVCSVLFELAAYLGWHIEERRPGDLRITPCEGLMRLGLRVAGHALIATVHADAPKTTRSELELLDERTEARRGRIVRHSRLRRRTFNVKTGALVQEEILDHDEKRAA